MALFHTALALFSQGGAERERPLATAAASRSSIKAAVITVARKRITIVHGAR